MIEPVSVPILLDLELEEEELDLSIEEAEEYAAQIGSLITISEVYGGLPSGGNAGEILIKNSDEDYDAIWGIIKNGANIWWTSHLITQGDTAIYAAKRYVIGRTDMQPEIHDFLVGRDIEVTEGAPNVLYEIIGINQLVYNLKRIGNIGENDYNKLLNKPRIDGIEINKDSTPASLGLATASALEEKYTKPSGGIPASDLAEGVIPEVHNVPSGGSVGQVLIKNSNEDYDANWSDIDSELPDVNSTDYGKVLAVSNDGIWNAQQPIFMVTITNNNNVFSANKTFSEITNAARHNMMVVATYANAYYQYCGIGGGTAVRQFVHIFTRDKVQTIKLFSVNINNVWTQYQYQLGTYSKPDSGIPANDLADDVHLIPAGGSEGYVLKKNSSNDYDVIWAEDSITEIKYFDFTWDGEHNPVPAIGVTGEAIFDAIINGKLVFARVTVGSLSYPYIFSLHAYYSNTLLQFVSVNGSIVNVLGYEYFFGQDTWYINEYIIPDPAQDTPANLGVAAVGSSSAFARADHVHAMPSAVDVGAYAKPSDGIPADDLADDVHLIPSGGTIGQVLRKISNNDWDIEWNTVNDGEDGSGVWYTTARISGGENPFVRRRSLIGREGATVQVHDLLFAPDVGHDGEPTTLYEITSVSIACLLNRLCKMQGEPGEDGVGVPSGGTIGQILKKKSGTDYDTEWANESAPVTSVNGQTGAVSLSIPTTASDVGAVAVAQNLADAGKVLAVNAAGNVVPSTLDDRFVVTFTPTSPDYSGTIDWSPAELAAAYEAGKRIIAYAPAFSFRCELSLATIQSGGLYTFDFIALGELNGQDIMVRLLTSDSESTYSVKIYPLSDVFIATYTIGQTSSCDKTYAEIMAAGQAGQTVIVRGTGGAVGQTANIYAIQNTSIVSILTLSAGSVIRITHTREDTITWDLLGIDVTDIQNLDQFLENKGYYEKPSTGIPASDLEDGVIPTIPTNVSAFSNDAGYLTQHQDISGKLDKAQGVAHAGEFCVVGSDGNITTVSMTAWQGGSY